MGIYFYAGVRVKRGDLVASCQSKDVNGTTTSFQNTACSFTEDAAILIPTPLTVTSPDVSSNDLARIALCSIDNEFSSSSATKPASAHCADSADIKYPADPRACAFSTNVFGQNANSSGLGVLGQDQPVCDGELALLGLQSLSAYPASGAKAPVILMADINNDDPIITTRAIGAGYGNDHWYKQHRQFGRR